ncbi:MAG: C25 family cysteine peptidase [Planctomycetota bacterium]
MSSNWCLRNVSFIILLLALSIIIEDKSYADVGDGIIVYGSNASTSVPQTRDYTVSSGNWSGATGLPNTVSGQETVINWVIIKANPIANEYVCGILSSANTRLTVYTWENGTWIQNWYDNATPSAVLKCFDIAYENNSGNWMVVYSNGATTNELSYRRRVDGVWDSSARTINSNRTTKAVERIKLASRPNSDEIALAFSDANDDLNVFVWFNDGTNYTWQAEPASILSKTLSTINSPKFDIDYEQVSGRVVLIYSIAAVVGMGVATKTAGSTTWTNTTDEGTFLDIADYIDIAPEPGTNYIAVASIASSTRDLQLGIWNNGAWVNRWNDRDTTVVTMATNYTPLGCGWAGTGAGRRAVFVYADVAAKTLPYFTWVKGAANPEQVANRPATYSPPLVSGRKQNIRIKQDPNFPTNGKMWIITVDSNSDLWAFTYDGTTSTTNWITVDTGVSGNNAVVTTTTVAVPMCGDATFTSINPTFAALVNFQAKPIVNGIKLNWQTSSELRTNGFRIWRQKGNNADELVEITKELVKAHGSTLFGASYSYLDTTTLSNNDYCYYLEDIEKSGKSQRYGPFSIDTINQSLDIINTPKNGHLRRDGRWEIDGKVIERRNSSTNTDSYSQDVKSPTLIKNKSIELPGPQNLQIAIDEEGIYEITGDDLNQFGWDISQINQTQINLFNKEEKIPIRIISAPYFAIQFYGKPPPPNRYTNTNIYYLKIDTGQTLRMNEVESIGNGLVNQFYWETLKVEQNEAYWPEFRGDNHWFSADELFAPTTKDISFNIDHIVTTCTIPAQLRLALQGASTLNGMNPGHQKVNIYINGQILNTAEWDNDSAYLFTSSVVTGLINEGENILTIELPDETQTIQQFVLVDYLEITYPRGFVARQDQISFTASTTGVQYYEINGFSAENIKVFVIHPNQPSEIDYITNFSIISESSQTKVLFGDNTISSTQYFVLSSDSIKKLLNITPINHINLKNTLNQADYIIITPNEFVDTLSPLVTQRTKNGLKVKVIPVENIYDEFNYGLFSPVTIRDFLKYTYEYWQKPAPRFVLLVGDGTFDYMDYWESGQTYQVPAYLLETPEMGETVSDNWFVNFDDDIIPEMIIGRLPVCSSDELTVVIDKIITYETSGRDSLPKRVLFSADIGDGFQEGAENLAQMLPSDYESVKLYLSQYTNVIVKQNIISATNQGLFLINHIGHGGVGILSSQRILEESDINSLNNTNKYPIMLTLNCLTGYFIYPSSVGLESLSELLLRAPDRGIIAAIAPTGLSSSTEQLVFAKGFYEALFNDRCSTLGNAYYQAMESLLNNKSLIGNTTRVNNIIQTFNLLGDPALNIGSTNYSSGSSGYGGNNSEWKCGYLGIEVLILIGLLTLIKSRKQRIIHPKK